MDRRKMDLRIVKYFLMIERRRWESEEERGGLEEHRIEERGNLAEDD